MYSAICNEVTDNKKVVFYKSFWTGKTTLSYDSQPMTKVKRNKFTYRDENGHSRQVVVKGNELIGIDLQFENGDVTIIRKLNWYEIILTFLPLYLIFIGGAIGGFCGATGAIINSVICRKIDNVAIKIFLSLVMTGIVTGIWYSLASMISF